MSPRDQATAAALLLRWFQAYQEGLIQDESRSVWQEREVSGLVAATKAFLSNQPTAQPSARAVLDPTKG